MGDGKKEMGVAAGAWRAPWRSSLAERLAFFSIPEPNSGCHLWLGKVNQSGRPTMTVGAKTRTAARVALELKIGRALLPDEFACHKCDMRLCVNDGHLFAGSHLANMADMRAKDRAPRGERGARAKLTPSAVLAILADERSNPAIAADHGINSRTVSDIKLGKRWAHLGRKS